MHQLVLVVQMRLWAPVALKRPLAQAAPKLQLGLVARMRLLALAGLMRR
jgi:hypothetical protein